jgi:murein DD-endopeptidase MepM/ murein hydrolase activator NlpD
MKKWPVPDSCSMILPEKEAPGSFWKCRKDRHHCGVDVYAPVGSTVITVESGKVIKSGIFTSQDLVPYWNTTYFVLVEHHSGLVSKYAEMENIVVADGEILEAGQLIGYVGEVLDLDKVTSESPSYIQELKKNGHRSMLHFELYQGCPIDNEEYLGGNIFNGSKPSNLLDPTDYLKGSAQPSVNLTAARQHG